MQSSKVRVAVIFGGQSAEHEVSCRSAASVFRFLNRSRYEVTPIRITRDGRWQVGVDTGPDTADAIVSGAAYPEADGRSPISTLTDALEALKSVQAAFPVMHGPYGEDGTIQALLDLAGVPYVGSGVPASAASMDKEFTKKIVAAEGIAVADGVVLREGDAEDISPEDKARLGLPVFVKPSCSGSSVGVSRVDDWADLPRAVRHAREHDTKVLIEVAVVGREVDLSVLQNPDGSIEVGPALEINLKSQEGFFDFDAKYTSGMVEFRIPAELDPAHLELLSDAARRAFRALGCAGLLRADFFLAEIDGRTVPVLNEVNTLPGFTELSQFPQMWRAAGVEYPELLDRLFTTALAAGPRRS
ncbi:D-alanine--D-alanine ligase family protein [Actinoplanes sichuanensis]|uniref:D-alanine--D-alanine ligase n=1 Tax=Actinoplanes sichuanensis TaxID=512349 RepID=A0ABW4ACV4_9ACTN|nr:D-alanine--D-alanine ligase family protein [Actinoplanes sichuanensis]